MQRLPTGLIFSGLLFLVLAVVFGWIVVPNIIKGKVSDQVQLRNGTAAFDKWSKLPPIYLKIYLFNVTNPTEVGRGKQKPKLQELGPYVYEQKREKLDLDFSEDASKVKYREITHYYFRPDLSNGTEQDNVSFINVPFVSLSNTVMKLPTVVGMLINAYIERFQEKLFIERTVKELLFEGFHQPMIAEIQNLTGRKVLVNETFGLFYPKNGTDDGEIEINSGVLDSQKFGQFLEYKNKTELDWWAANSTCNMLNGSDGSLFPPFVKKDSTLKIYAADLCRSLYFTFNSDVKYLGLNGYKFTLPSEVLASPRENPDNICFCSNPGENYEGCYKKGTSSLSECRKGAPILASTPHFLDGDEEYLNQSIGLNPIREKHETFIEVEPLTGVVLRVKKRIQINMDVRRRRSIDGFAKIQSQIFPLFWIEEGGALAEDSAIRIKKNLLSKMDMVSQARWAALGISCFFIGIGIAIAFVRARKKNYHI